MVILKNVTKTDKYISADYFPEEQEKKGYMKLSLDDLSVVEHIRSGMMAPAHVEDTLARLSKMDNPPKERTVLWY